MSTICILAIAIIVALFCWVMALISMNANNEEGRKIWINVMKVDVVVTIIIFIIIQMTKIGGV